MAGDKEHERPRGAISIPTEHIVTGDGTEYVRITTLSTDKEAEDVMIKVLEQNGLEKVDGERKSGSTTSFSSSDWNISWNPTGPKPSWAEPDDPTVN